MTPEQFVDALRSVVCASATDDVIGNLTRPPGRSPAKALREMSAWYLRLGEPDRAMLKRIVEDAVHSTMFGVLCVLDGVRAIEDSGGQRTLELDHVGPDGRTRLNDPGVDLHDLL